MKYLIKSAVVMVLLLLVAGCGSNFEWFPKEIAPVANAGTAQKVTTGTLVTLDGSASSDGNDDPLAYRWTLTTSPSGSSAALSSATVVKPVFTPVVAGDYVVSLVVNDGSSNSNTATVTITVTAANTAPIANAGPDQTVTAGAQVTLDGSGSSDGNSDTLTYSWSVTTKPDGSSAELSIATAQKPTFTAAVAGTYVFSLIVNDSKVNSTPDTVTVTAAATANAP